MKVSLPTLVSMVVAGLLLALGWQAPLCDDGLFWWVPKALIFLEQGPSWVAAGELPLAAVADTALPPQWRDGLPDYGHPPLWYGWMALWMKVFGTSAGVIHLAVLPLALAIGAGLAALLHHLGGRKAAWTAPAILLLPPVSAELLRADTDLPLLVFSTWALVALLERRELRFALLASLATLSKEPGVLLAVPALAACVLDRRLRWGWLAPPVALLTWGAIHWAVTGGALGGWAFSGAEHLPGSLGDWASDIWSVARISLFAQGRWVLWLLAAWALFKRPVLERRAALLVGVHTLAQLGFFSTLNFLGGIDRVDRYTHVRYLLPGMTSATALGLGAFPLAAVPLTAASLWKRHDASPDGPEASLWGTDTGLALQKALPTIDSLEGPVWVGSYSWTQLTRTWAGVVDEARSGLHCFGILTRPDEVSGHLLHASVGEPLGRLQELDLELVEEFRHHEAWVRLYRIP